MAALSAPIRIIAEPCGYVLEPLPMGSVRVIDFALGADHYGIILVQVAAFFIRLKLKFTTRLQKKSRHNLIRYKFIIPYRYIPRRPFTYVVVREASPNGYPPMDALFHAPYSLAAYPPMK